MIELKDLHVRFGPLRAVDGLTLAIPEGSLYGLLGPNGAGKTTTISCIAGLLRPTAGFVRVGGVDVGASPERVQRLLGLVPQSLALYPTLTVAQNLRVFGALLGLHGKRLRERLSWGLGLARLAGREHSVVETLSGGMQRRLNLACALLHDPPIVICDEPTAGVDPQSRNHLFETIRALHADGRTIVYTTHYMEEVEALCDRVAIIDGGRLVTEGALAELLRAGGGASAFTVQVSDGESEERVRDALASAGVAVDAVHAAPRSLEDVFLDLTGRALRDGGAAPEKPAGATEETA